MAGKIYVGIGGWTYAPWRGAFYPEGLPHKRELAFASRRLSSIEINATYYSTFKAESWARWRDETPDGFVFSVKGPRYCTNRRVLAEAGPSIDRFLASGITELGDKLGPINWQFATTKTFDREDFEAFLNHLPASLDGRVIRHAVEVRHDSFRCAEFISLARTHGVAVVIAADSDYPLIAKLTAPFVYARLMGTSDTEESGYAPVALDQWADRARLWSHGGGPNDLAPLCAPPPDPAPARDVYLYVISGFKERNPAAATGLCERISETAP